MADSVPDKILHYNVIEIAGEGPQGAVYKAYDSGLDRIVALKLHHETSSPKKVSDQQLRYRAQCISDLKHPNLCPVFAAEQYNGQLLIIREYIEGQTVSALVRSRPLDEAAFYGLATQIIRGLRAAHEMRIMHGNIKANNIIVGEDGIARVTDFCLAKPLELHESDHAALDPEQACFFPPEQIRKGELKLSADLFSLGVVFYMMLAGEVPFRGRGGGEVLNAVLYGQPDFDLLRRRGVHGDTILLLDKMLAKIPVDRFQSAGELLLSADAIVDFEQNYKRREIVAGSGRSQRWYLLVSLAAAVLILIWYIVTMGR